MSAEIWSMSLTDSLLCQTEPEWMKIKMWGLVNNYKVHVQKWWFDQDIALYSSTIYVYIAGNGKHQCKNRTGTREVNTCIQRQNLVQSFY